jgi:hypothetical protein
MVVSTLPVERRGQRKAKQAKPVHKAASTTELQGHVERVQSAGRFLQLRFGKEPGDYVIFHVVPGCRISRAGEALPLKDVQFCDTATVRYHRHPRFDLELAQEIELN